MQYFPGDEVLYMGKTFVVVSEAEDRLKWGEDVGAYMFTPEFVWAYFLGEGKPYKCGSGDVTLVRRARKKVVRKLPEWF